MKSQHCRQKYRIELLFHSFIGSWPHKIQNTTEHLLYHENNFFSCENFKNRSKCIVCNCWKKEKV